MTDTNHRADSSQSFSHPTSPASNASVVVWDTSPLSLLALAGAIDAQGYQCICARDGEAAIKAFDLGQQDLLVCDVGDDAPSVLEVLGRIRSMTNYDQFPAVLLADQRWMGLEKKAEVATAPTRCLFKPIDPNSLLAVVDQLLWMPALVSGHRRRGTRPSRPGWITL